MSLIVNAGPGPAPSASPWSLLGSALSYDNGGVTLPSSVTGGNKGVGTINLEALFLNGTSIFDTTFPNLFAGNATFSGTATAPHFNSTDSGGLQLGGSATKGLWNDASDVSVRAPSPTGTIKFETSGGAAFAATEGGSTTIHGSGVVTDTNALFDLDKTPGNTNRIAGRAGGSLTWGIALGDAAPRTGGNAGDNFSISSYTDAGAFYQAPFSILREDGTITTTGIQRHRGSASLLWIDAYYNFTLQDRSRVIADAADGTNLAFTGICSTLATNTFYGAPSSGTQCFNAFAINDDTAATGPTGAPIAVGYFASLRRLPGVGGITCNQFDVDNGGTLVDIDPFTGNAGQTWALELTSGAYSPANDAGAAIVIGSGDNGAHHFRRGIVCLDTAFSPSVGNGGAGLFCMLATGHSLALWKDVGGTYPAEIYGTIDGLFLNSKRNHIAAFVGDTAIGAGYVGHVLESTSSPTTINSATVTNITSVVLTPGTWRVSGAVYYNPAATTTTSFVRAGASTTTGAYDASTTFVQTPVQAAADEAVAIVIPTRYIRVNVDTTTYLVCDATFAVSTMQATGRLAAERMH